MCGTAFCLQISLANFMPVSPESVSSVHTNAAPAASIMVWLLVAVAEAQTQTTLFC